MTELNKIHTRVFLSSSSDAPSKAETNVGTNRLIFQGTGPTTQLMDCFYSIATR